VFFSVVVSSFVVDANAVSFLERHVSQFLCHFLAVCCVKCLSDKCRIPGITSSAVKHGTNIIRPAYSSILRIWLKHIHGTGDMEGSGFGCQ